MVALVISGIVVGVVFDLMLGQTRFVRYLNAREEVQQNTRAAVELIASELRGVAPRGLEAAFRDSIAFRSPRVWGTICRRPDNLTTVDLALQASLGISYSVGSDDTRPGLVFETSTPGRDSRLWSTDRTVTDVSASTCPAQTGVEMRRFTLAAGDTVGMRVGHTAYLFDRVAYSPGTSNFPGTWIRRRVGTASYQPFAGPIRMVNETNQGLIFRYYADEAELVPGSTGLTPLQRNDVTRIEVAVESISRGAKPQSKLERTSVFLRNR